MEKRRVKLNINGVICGLITDESEDYMQGLAREIEDAMKAMLAVSPYVTREMAAITAALGYCDEAKKNGELAKRAQELEIENAELWEELERLEPYKATGGQASQGERAARVPRKKKELKNPLKRNEEYEHQGFVSFFEKPE